MEAETVKPAVAAIMSAASASQRDGGFTADDLAAADQLVQLSVSGGGEEDACSSSSLSARSVNNAEAVAPVAAREDEEQDGEDGDDANAGVVDRRARKRYRLVSELYAATKRVKSSTAGGGGSRRKSRDRMEK
ncbi:hypothetical protein EJB05_47726, partial [Eragrostis curvula]